MTKSYQLNHQNTNSALSTQTILQHCKPVQSEKINPNINTSLQFEKTFEEYDKNKNNINASTNEMIKKKLSQQTNLSKKENNNANTKRKIEKKSY